MVAQDTPIASSFVTKSSANSCSYASINKALQDASRHYQEGFHETVVVITVDWKDLITDKFDTHLMDLKKARGDVRYYTQKVAALEAAQQKTGTQRQTEKLQSNKEKLAHAERTFQRHDKTMQGFLKEVIDKSWKDLLPIVLQYLQLQAVQTHEVAHVHQHFQTVIGQLTKTAKKYGLQVSSTPTLLLPEEQVVTKRSKAEAKRNTTASSSSSKKNSQVNSANAKATTTTTESEPTTQQQEDQENHHPRQDSGEEVVESTSTNPKKKQDPPSTDQTVKKQPSTLQEKQPSTMQEKQPTSFCRSNSSSMKEVDSRIIPSPPPSEILVSGEPSIEISISETLRQTFTVNEEPDSIQAVKDWFAI